jgi:hypothetical protein
MRTRKVMERMRFGIYKQILNGRKGSTGERKIKPRMKGRVGQKKNSKFCGGREQAERLT